MRGKRWNPKPERNPGRRLKPPLRYPLETPWPTLEPRPPLACPPPPWDPPPPCPPLRASAGKVGEKQIKAASRTRRIARASLFQSLAQTHRRWVMLYFP